MTDVNQTATEIQFPLAELKSISEQIQKGTNAPADGSWSDSAFSCSFSIGPAGGNLQGWFTYYDGKKLHFQLDKISQKTGTAAGAIAWPLIRLRDFSEVGTHGTFELHGSWFSAQLKLTTGNRDLTSPPWITVSCAGIGDFKMSGTVNYEKVAGD